MVRVLITGGAGFIGSHLADALLARGDSVTALDNLSTGARTNIDHLIDHPRFSFVQDSVLDELAVDQAVQGCDLVIHLAAAVGVQLIVSRPLRSLLTNIRGSEIVLDAAHRHRKKVLLASTSEIYGKNSSGPLAETADRVLGSPRVARWAYSTSKAVDEILAYAYLKEYGLPTIVVRLFNTVGPRQSPAYGMVIPRFAQQAVMGQDLTVHGDGTQTRCFCHVRDVVYALLALVDEPAAVGEVFNVGASEEISISALAERVIAMAESNSKVRFVPYEDAYEQGFEDMQRRVPDTTKIRDLLGWKPECDLDHILEQVVAEARQDAGPTEAIAMRAAAT